MDDSLVYKATDSIAVRPCLAARISTFPDGGQAPSRHVELKNTPLLLLAFIAQPHFEGNAASGGEPLNACGAVIAPSSKERAPRGVDSRNGWRKNVVHPDLEAHRAGWPRCVSGPNATSPFSPLSGMLHLH